MNKFIKFIGYIAISIIGTILNGYALSVLWQWFIGSTFALPAISIAEAIGISMVVGYLTKQYVQDAREVSEQVAFTLAKPVVFLLVGWIVTKFM